MQTHDPFGDARDRVTDIIDQKDGESQKRRDYFANQRMQNEAFYQHELANLDTFQKQLASDLREALLVMLTPDLRAQAAQPKQRPNSPPGPLHPKHAMIHGPPCAKFHTEAAPEGSPNRTGYN